MKKFLTVLLVVSVLFTFSFGSAFAAEAVTPSVTKTHDEAMVEAKAEALKDITTAATNAKTALSATYKDVYWGSARDLTATIAGSVYAATIDEMAANAAKAVEKAFATVDTTYPTEATVATLKGYLLNTQVDLNVEYDETVQLPARSASEHMSVMTQATGTPGSEWTKYYAVYTYTNALADLKAYVNGEIAKIVNKYIPASDEK
ncbi:MAG: hypothetical protein IKW01_03110 [Firmicutes bacterium]|nr:hypothetical protein [Bacillota bacterium]